ncbi:hypothetical protein Rhopal_001882-T1 [Rhodotorula paludigena]|uniref:J domain-containing protein n=1 Tax=Rhodotorula paludigena TaxID=86838 RepID=A0AAV5G8J5_9BASI|nr:hypothetical protein Rhopal_001882-T1 [Rhodotorula paludigena]
MRDTSVFTGTKAVVPLHHRDLPKRVYHDFDDDEAEVVRRALDYLEQGLVGRAYRLLSASQRRSGSSEVAAQNVQHLGSLVARLDSLHRAGKHADMLSILDEAEKLWSTRSSWGLKSVSTGSGIPPEARYWRFECLVALQRWDELVVTVNSLPKTRDASFPHRKYYLATAYYHRGNLSLAAKAAEACGEHNSTPKMRKFLELIEKTDELVTGGQSARECRKYEKAVRKLSKALALDPQNKRIQVMVLTERALTHFKDDDLEAALVDAQAALQLDPQALSAFSVVIDVLYERKDYVRVLQEILKALEVARSNPVQIPGKPAVWFDRLNRRVESSLRRIDRAAQAEAKQRGEQARRGSEADAAANAAREEAARAAEARREEERRAREEARTAREEEEQRKKEQHEREEARRAAEEEEMREQERKKKQEEENARQTSGTDNNGSPFEGKNLYEILGVDVTAAPAQIKKAFMELSLVMHPDKPGGCAERFKFIQAAYSILFNQDLRKRYDDITQNGEDRDFDPFSFK